MLANIKRHMIATEIRRRLESAAHIAYALRPSVFGRLVLAIYRDFYGNADVRHVGGSGDNGVDLYAIIDDDPCIVQIN